MSKIVKERPRLGRGLSSLISVNAPAPAPEAPQTIEAPPPEATPAASPPTAEPAQIPLAQISPNPHQPRKAFSDASLAELAASLKTTGLIQPIVVRHAEGGYQLIAGERRWRAAKMAGLETVPAIVRDVDSLTQAQMALVENVQREDLNPIDRAAAYRTLIDQLGLTQSELAARIGEDRSSIANFLRLLDLAAAVRQRLIDGTVSLGHAKILAGVPDAAEQIRLATLVAEQGLSVRNLERILAGESPPAKAKTTPTASPHVQSLETSLARQLGMRVQLKAGGKGKGRLVIHYASLDQFDDLVQRLGVKLDD